MRSQTFRIIRARVAVYEVLHYYDACKDKNAKIYSYAHHKISLVCLESNTKVNCDLLIVAN